MKRLLTILAMAACVMLANTGCVEYTKINKKGGGGGGKHHRRHHDGHHGHHGGHCELREAPVDHWVGLTLASAGGGACR